MKTSKKNCHVISNTHWDREWRYSVWQNRQMLVELVDKLIELMEQHSEYRHYILDGQSVVVQDYLEIRSENALRLKKLICDGRIQVGPWYTLPHEFAVSGESLVRNLLVGLKKAEEYGRACKIGYTVFSFGQVSQLPQIYAGFGIDKIMVCKRVSKVRAPNCEFLWESPDGTRALATRYGDHGRGNYFYFLYIPTLFGKSLWNDAVTALNPNWIYDYGMGGRPCHLIDNESNYQDTYLLENPCGWFPEKIPQGIKDCEYSVRESTVSSPKLYSESADFCVPTLNSIKIIDEANKHLSDSKFVHSSIEDFMNELAAHVKTSDLKVVTGELRDGPGAAVQSNVHSLAIPIKLKNCKAETALTALAEPLAFMAASVGMAYPDKMLERAWEYLLKSHPHDSINGLGDKSIWSNTLYRLDQVIDISDTITTRAIQQIVQNLDNSEEPADAILFTVFNTMPQVRTANIEISIDLPEKSDIGSLVIKDMVGNILTNQIVDVQTKKNAVISKVNRPLPYEALRVKMRVEIPNIPAMGYMTCRVYFNTLQCASVVMGMDVDTGCLLSAFDTMENKHLIVKINQNGTLDITRKQTGHTFRQLMYFEDRGNIGMCHTRRYPLKDEICTTLLQNAALSVVENGPYSCAVKVKTVMRVPDNTDFQNGRSSHYVNIDIEYIVRLTESADKVDIQLEVDNTAQNHITRMVFPTWLKTNDTHADTPFDVHTRTLVPRSPSEPADWAMDEQPCYSFVDINDGNEGLAILTGGLNNYELLCRDDRPICIAVIRAVECMVDTGEAVTNHYQMWKHSQMLGKQSLSFSIYLHANTWQVALVNKKAAEFITPIKVAQHGVGKGTLGAANSWMDISPDCIRLSAVKKANNSESVIVRLYNPTAFDVQTLIKLGFDGKHIWQCRLDESRITAFPASNIVKLNIPAKKIITLEIAR